MEFARRLTVQWSWGLAAVLAGIALWTAIKVFALLRPERDALRSSIMEASVAQERTQAAGRNATAILHSLPEGGRSNGFLSSLLREAIKAQVELRNVEVLPPADDAKSSLEQVRVSAKLFGTYSDVKRTVAEAMREEPSTALDSIVITRMSQAQGVEAHIQWSVYYRSAGGR